MNKTEYSIEKGQLIILELLTGRTMRCDFDVAVSEVLPIPEDDCLVLLDPDAMKKLTFENLLKVRRDGSVEWKAALPQSHDTFVSMEACGDRIEANTWSGYRVEIDLSSGQIKSVRFVK
jgi:hypothetical protein